jgi:hypothetical protein
VTLPDAQKGFYRGTRYDWSGIVTSLEWGGHVFFGPFFERIDAHIAVEFGFEQRFLAKLARGIG